MSAVLVVGGTGTVGRPLVDELIARGCPVRVLTGDPQRAAGLFGGQVPLTTGDPATAMAGVDAVFLCTANRPDQVERETAVIDAAVAGGVGRLVKLGAAGSRIGSPVAFWDAHGRIVEHLWASGLPATVLEPATFQTNVLAAFDPRSATLVAPAGAAAPPMIDPRDVAAVAAMALTEDGHTGRDYTLTGPAPVSFKELAAELAALLGRPVDYVDLPDDAARAGMVAAGLPPWFADQLVALWGELRRGAGPAVTDVVRVLTGREPRPVAAFLREHAAAFSRT